MKPFARLGFIGRFKPVHLGVDAALDALCTSATDVVIGIGSANKYSIRNPFTAVESEAMLHATLTAQNHKNYHIVHIDDFGNQPEYTDGARWREEIIKHFGKLDAFVTGNPYVGEILQNTYQIIHPTALIPSSTQQSICATQVRVEMARGEKWREYVSPVVVTVLEEQGLVDRFRREYGFATLTQHAHKSFETLKGPETRDEERMRVLFGDVSTQPVRQARERLEHAADGIYALRVENMRSNGK